jgi:peptide/nickel transport system substrate-binding protein
MKSATILAASCALALGMSACGGGGGGTVANYRSGGTYTESLPSDPGNLHPLLAVQQTTFAVIPFAYDSLTNVDARGRVVGELAQRWHATATQATFTLRPGITCSDGAKLTASDVAATFNWIKDPKNKSTLIGDKLPSGDFTVQADDAARTVTVRLPQPDGFLLQNAGSVPIVCPKGLANPKALAHATDGTGPFRLTDYVADDHLTLTARKGYRWGPGGASTGVRGFPSKVVFKIVKDESTVANLVLSGQLTAGALQGPDEARLEGRGFFEATELDGPEDLFFNQRRGHATADPAVRKALAMALDLDQLVKVVTQGRGVRPDALSILRPRACNENTVAGALPAHDQAAAATLLDGAGWKAGPGGIRVKDGQKLSLTLLYPTAGQPGVSAGMELISQWWKQLGVDVKLKGQDTNADAQTLFAGNAWDATWIAVAVQYPHEFVPFASGPISPEGQNFAAIKNAQYEKLAAQAVQTTGKPGCDLWRQAEQALFRDADVVPATATKTVTYAKQARLAAGSSGTEPTSIRLLAN